MADLCLVALTEICPPSRKRKRRKRDDANCGTITKEHKNAISFRLLVPHAILLHVASHEDVRLVKALKFDVTWGWQSVLGQYWVPTAAKAQKSNPETRMGKWCLYDMNETQSLQLLYAVSSTTAAWWKQKFEACMASGQQWWFGSIANLLLKCNLPRSFQHVIRSCDSSSVLIL